jgi:hypothetical protein
MGGGSWSTWNGQLLRSGYRGGREQIRIPSLPQPALPQIFHMIVIVLEKISTVPFAGQTLASGVVASPQSTPMRVLAHRFHIAPVCSVHGALTSKISIRCAPESPLLAQTMRCTSVNGKPVILWSHILVGTEMGAFCCGVLAGTSMSFCGCQ